MLGKSILEGIRLIRRRFRLVALIYALNLVFVFLVVFPLYKIMVDSVGLTGFGEDLMSRFDILLWREIVVENKETLLQVLRRVLIAIPIYLMWKTATQVGVIYALHQGAIWPFWSGVYFYTLRGLLIGLFFFLFRAFGIVAVFLSAEFLRLTFFNNSVGVFWIYGVAVPIILLSALAILELYQRYARLSLVVRNDNIWRAIRSGFVWPQRYSVISLVYICWYAISLGVFLISLVVNAKLHVGFSLLLVSLVIQQAIMLARSAVTVGWIGSEVFLFENVSAKKGQAK